MFVRLVKHVSIYLKRVIKKVSGLFIRVLFFDSIYSCNIRRYEKVDENNTYKSIRRLSPFGGWLAYKKMTMDVLDEFGASPEFREIFFLKKDILMLHNLYIKYYAQGGETKAKRIVTMINIKVNKLIKLNEENQKKSKKQSRRKANATQHRIVSDWCNQDTRKMTVFDYNNCLNDYQKYLEDAKKNNKR